MDQVTHQNAALVEASAAAANAMQAQAKQASPVVGTFKLASRAAPSRYGGTRAFDNGPAGKSCSPALLFRPPKRGRSAHQAR